MNFEGQLQKVFQPSTKKMPTLLSNFSCIQVSCLFEREKNCCTKQLMHSMCAMVVSIQIESGSCFLRSGGQIRELSGKIDHMGKAILSTIRPRSSTRKNQSFHQEAKKKA